MIPQAIIDEILDHFNAPPKKIQRLGGGSINQAFQFQIENKKYFLKFNDSYPKIIEFEKEGLDVIQQTQMIQVPELVKFGKTEAYEYLILAFVESSTCSDKFWQSFGQQLAEMHLQAKAESFGWTHDNYLGSLPQHNNYNNDFCEFWISQRIRPQMRRARDQDLLNSKDIKAFENLFLRVKEIFPDEEPCLVHGDLWSGNFIGNDQTGPLLIDPAIHYGHSETDLAFTYLFGGFSPAFYQAYEEKKPLAPGFIERIRIYNLYPLLLHLNLFGSSYYTSIQSGLKAFY